MSEDNLAHARRDVAAIEAGATGDALAAFFAPDVVITEMPNRFAPRGQRRELPALLAGAERGRQILRDQRYAIVSAIAQGERVAVELDWSATTAVELGPIAPGTALRAHIAIFLDYRDGRIAAQRHYDCYEPF